MQGQGGGRGSLTDPLDDGRITHIDGTQPMTPKQVRTLMKANFEKLKKDSAELATLAKQLREELDKPEASTLSLESMNRIERIEKLAKKIRDEMKGF